MCSNIFITNLEGWENKCNEWCKSLQRMYAIYKMQCTIVHFILHMYVENVRIIYKAMVVAAFLAVRQFIAKLYFSGKRGGGGGTQVTG